MTLVRELGGPHWWTQVESYSTCGPSWNSVISGSWASQLTHLQRWQAGHLAMTLNFAVARWHQRKEAGVGTLTGLCATEAFMLLSQAPSRGGRQDRAPGFSGKLGKQACLSCLGCQSEESCRGELWGRGRQGEGLSGWPRVHFLLR